MIKEQTLVSLEEKSFQSMLITLTACLMKKRQWDNPLDNKPSLTRTI